MMKKSYLLPHKFKKIGWVLLILGVITGLICLLLGVNFDDLLVVNVFSFTGDDFLSKTKPFSFVKNGILDELITFFI